MTFNLSVPSVSRIPTGEEEHGTHILHRQMQENLPIASSGDGPYVIDTEGKRYLDACGGAAVSCLGYSHPRVTQAIKAQLDKIAFVHSAFFRAY